MKIFVQLFVSGAFIEPKQASDFLNSFSSFSELDRGMSDRTKAKQNFGHLRNNPSLYLNKWELHGSLGTEIYSFFHGQGNGSFGCWSDREEMLAAKNELINIFNDFVNVFYKHISVYDLKQTDKGNPELFERLRQWMKMYSSLPRRS